MPLSPALGKEPDILHEDALVTAPALLAGAPTGRRTAPAQKTGVGGSLPGAKPDESVSTALISLLDKSLGYTGDVWKKFNGSKSQDRTALDKAMKDSLEAMVRAEGTALLDAMPFGTMLHTAFELSMAFADGVGRALDTINAELAQSYDFGQLGQELDEHSIALIRKMEGYQAEATRRLPQVLSEGLADVVNALVDKGVGAVTALPAKVLQDVAGQLAAHLVKRNDLLAVLHAAVEEAGKSIPAARGKVERLVMRFAAKAYLDQLSDKDLQKKLADLPNVAKAGKAVDVALLGTLITMLAQNSYDTYKRYVDVDTAGNELKGLLTDAARSLTKQLEHVALVPSSSGQVEMSSDKIAVPPGWLATITAEPDTTRAVEELRWSREKEFLDYCRRLALQLEARRLGYRQQFRRRSPGGTDVELWVALQGRWVDDWKSALARARASIEDILQALAGSPHVNQLSLELLYAHAVRHIGDPTKELGSAAGDFTTRPF